MKLLIPDSDLPSFVACLTLGTLEAIRTGALPAEAGIWFLGRPSFWSPLMNSGLIAPEIIEVLQTCDELDALQTLNPEHFSSEITLLIKRVLHQLSQASEPVWQMTWDAET